MEFTPIERKMIERLRKQQRQWPMARWLVLCLGLACAANCAVFLYWDIHLYRESSRMTDITLSHISEMPSDQQGKQILGILPTMRDQTIVAVAFIPIWLFWGVMASRFFAIVIVHWRGHAERILLLKLLDAQENRSI